MLSASDFRNGVTFEMDGNVMQVVEFQHVKPGKGAAFVRTKMKNVITGAVTETTFNPSDKFENAYVERKDMEYSYTTETCIIYGYGNLRTDSPGRQAPRRQLSAS
jgi:elongation factor P